jgi:hypothetical protein
MGGAGGLMKDMTHGMVDKFDNFTCGRVDLMGEIVTRKQYQFSSPKTS